MPNFNLNLRVLSVIDMHIWQKKAKLPFFHSKEELIGSSWSYIGGKVDTHSFPCPISILRNRGLVNQYLKLQRNIGLDCLLGSKVYWVLSINYESLNELLLYLNFLFYKIRNNSTYFIGLFKHLKWVNNSKALCPWRIGNMQRTKVPWWFSWPLITLTSWTEKLRWRLLW